MFVHKVFSVLVVFASMSLLLGGNRSQATSSSIRADQLSPSAPVSPPLLPTQAPQLIAQQSRVRRLQFPAGKSSTTLEDAVVRGTRDIYLVGAKQGQTMKVKIASVENNASFSVTAPPNKAGQRRTLTPDAVNWTATLPASGDYQIIVGSSRGNASYTLQVAIK